MRAPRQQYPWAPRHQVACPARLLPAPNTSTSGRAPLSPLILEYSLHFSASSSLCKSSTGSELASPLCRMEAQVDILPDMSLDEFQKKHLFRVESGGQPSKEDGQVGSCRGRARAADVLGMGLFAATGLRHHVPLAPVTAPASSWAPGKAHCEPGQPAPTCTQPACLPMPCLAAPPPPTPPPSAEFAQFYTPLPALLLVQPAVGPETPTNGNTVAPYPGCPSAYYSVWQVRSPPSLRLGRGRGRAPPY